MASLTHVFVFFWVEAVKTIRLNWLRANIQDEQVEELEAGTDEDQCSASLECTLGEYSSECLVPQHQQLSLPKLSHQFFNLMIMNRKHFLAITQLVTEVLN
jgi:hypothetical protein